MIRDPRIEGPGRGDHGSAAAIKQLLGQPDRRVRRRVFVGSPSAAYEQDDDADIAQGTRKFGRCELQYPFIVDALEEPPLRSDAPVCADDHKLRSGKPLRNRGSSAHLDAVLQQCRVQPVGDHRKGLTMGVLG